MLLLTPINRSPKSLSHINYLKELQSEIDGDVFQWDDGSRQNARVNDIFGFVFNNVEVRIRRVKGVLDATHRRAHWSEKDRQVVVLSPEIKVIQWDDWIVHGGAKKVQGTIIVRSNLDSLYHIINAGSEP